MFSLEDDIPAVRRLMWGLVLAVLLITVFFYARLYFAFGSADEGLGWLELVVMVGVILALLIFTAVASGHLTRLRQIEEARGHTLSGRTDGRIRQRERKMTAFIPRERLEKEREVLTRYRQLAVLLVGVFISGYALRELYAAGFDADAAYGHALLLSGGLMWLMLGWGRIEHTQSDQERIAKILESL